MSKSRKAPASGQVRYFRCYQCEPPPDGHEFISDKRECDRCGARSTQRVAEITPVHFVYPDPDGIIMGNHGLRYSIACEPKNPGLITSAPQGLKKITPAVVNNQPRTDHPPAVTCPACRLTKTFLEALERMAIEKAMAGGLRIEGLRGGGCCG